jgi:hypothetical protein
MSILRKSIDEIEIFDLNDLVARAARETDELEFKGDLPFQLVKGSPSVADRWHEKGDRLGDYARDKLLAEIVAFANASGGTLVVGLHETKDEPRRAEGLAVLPRCEDLARRLLDASEDMIEPRLPTLAAKAILDPERSDGSGYVVLRTGKSSIGPHRLSSTREFYTRRGERAARMNVREIKEQTLELARSGDRIEQTFAARRTLAKANIARLNLQPSKGVPPVLIRVTGTPTSPQMIDNLTRRPDLWWTGQPFTVMIDGKSPCHCSYPADDFYRLPVTRLRSFVGDNESDVKRLVRADGTVEFCFEHPTGEEYRGTNATVFWSWLIAVVTGTIAQIDRLRHRLAWDSVEYGLEVELTTSVPLRFLWSESIIQTGTVVKEIPLLLPRYSVTSPDQYDDILTTIMRDIFNASGVSANTRCAVPWDTIANTV